MLHSINYCMCVFLKFICIYFFLYYRGPCVRKLFTGLIMYYPLKIKNIVLYCIVLYCIMDNGKLANQIARLAAIMVKYSVYFAVTISHV